MPIRKVLYFAIFLFPLFYGCSSMPRSNHDFGGDISAGEQVIFEDQLKVQAFQRAVIFTKKDGCSKIIKIKSPSPYQPPIGHIRNFYNRPDQAQACGTPLQGEHLIFSDEFRVHIFEKGILVWRKSDAMVQSVLCQKPFIH